MAGIKRRTTSLKQLLTVEEMGRLFQSANRNMTREMGVAYAADICRLFREGDLTSAGMALRLAVDALSGFEALKVCHCHHTLEKHFCRICHRRYGEYCREEKHASECAGCTDTQGYPQCSAYREALGRGVPAEDNIPKKALGPGEPEQG